MPNQTPSPNSYDFLMEQVNRRKQEYVRQQELQAQRTQNEATIGAPSRALKRGLHTTGASLAGLAGLAGSATGLESLSNWGYDTYRSQQEKASLYPGMEMGDVTGPITGAQWLGEKVIEQAPVLGLTAATAGVGGLSAMGGRFLGSKVLGSVVQNAASVGMKTGMALASGGMEAGSNYGELRERGIDAPYSSLMSGAVSGFIETLGGNSRIINQVLGETKGTSFGRAANRIREAYSKGNVPTDTDFYIIKRSMTEALTQAREEGIQEMLQEGVSITNVALNDPTFEAFSRDNAMRIAESGLTGAGVGGVLGGVTGPMGGRDRLAREKAANLTEDQLAQAAMAQVQKALNKPDVTAEQKVADVLTQEMSRRVSPDTPPLPVSGPVDAAALYEQYRKEPNRNIQQQLFRQLQAALSGPQAASSVTVSPQTELPAEKPSLAQRALNKVRGGSRELGTKPVSDLDAINEIMDRPAVQQDVTVTPHEEVENNARAEAQLNEKPTQTPEASPAPVAQPQEAVPAVEEPGVTPEYQDEIRGIGVESVPGEGFIVNQEVDTRMRELESRLGRRPSKQEIADDMEVSREQAGEILRRFYGEIAEPVAPKEPTPARALNREERRRQLEAGMLESSLVEGAEETKPKRDKSRPSATHMDTRDGSLVTVENSTDPVLTARGPVYKVTRKDGRSSMLGELPPYFVSLEEAKQTETPRKLSKEERKAVIERARKLEVPLAPKERIIPGAPNAKPITKEQAEEQLIFLAKSGKPYVTDKAAQRQSDKLKEQGFDTRVVQVSGGFGLKWYDPMAERRESAMQTARTALQNAQYERDFESLAMEEGSRQPTKPQPKRAVPREPNVPLPSAGGVVESLDVMPEPSAKGATESPAQKEITLRRMGDFYEAFDEDAELLGEETDVAVSTGKESAGEEKTTVEDAKEYTPPEGVAKRIDVVYRDGKYFLFSKSEGTYFSSKPTFAEAAAVADKENIRMQEGEDSVSREQAKYPDLPIGRDAQDFARVLGNRKVAREFMAQAKEVGYIDRAYGHRATVYYYRGSGKVAQKLVRVSDESPSGGRTVHEVDLAKMGEAFHWLQRKDVASIAEKFGAVSRQEQASVVSDSGYDAQGNLKPARNTKTVIEQKPSVEPSLTYAPSGRPFKTEAAAKIYAKKNNLSAEPVAVEGGFALSTKPASEAPVSQKVSQSASQKEAGKEPWEMTLNEYFASKGIDRAHVSDAQRQKVSDEHRALVQEALNQGQKVPPQVLSLHPGLKAQPKAEKSKPAPQPQAKKKATRISGDFVKSDLGTGQPAKKVGVEPFIDYLILDGYEVEYSQSGPFPTVTLTKGDKAYAFRTKEEIGYIKKVEKEDREDTQARLDQEREDFGGEIRFSTRPKKKPVDESVREREQERKAIEKFGLTRNPRKALFILPDGQMIHSGKNHLSKSHINRPVHHINVLEYLFPETDREKFPAPVYEKNLHSLMQAGWIRVTPEFPNIELRANPTPRQLELLQEYINSFPESETVHIDLFSPDNQSVENRDLTPRERRLFSNTVENFFSKKANEPTLAQKYLYSNRADEASGTGQSKDTVQRYVKSIVANEGFTRPVTVVQSVTDIPDPAQRKAAIAKQKEGFIVAGFFDPTTGGVILVADGIENRRHAHQVVLEEVVAHDGLRQVLGGEFDSFLEGLLNDKRYKDAILAYAKEAGYADQPTIGAEEWLADRIKTNQLAPTVWSRLIAAVRKALNALGFNITLSDTELRELTRKAYAAARKTGNARGKGEQRFSTRSQRIKTLDAKEQSELIRLAVQKYGVTDDFNRAGFILPDGRLLDISRREDKGYRPARAFTHDQISFSLLPGMPGFESLSTLLSHGWVRVFPEGGAIELESEPSPEAYGQIRKYLERPETRAGGKVAVDVTDRKTGENEHLSLWGGDIDQAVDMIQRFYAGQDVYGAPSLARQFRFSAKKSKGTELESKAIQEFGETERPASGFILPSGKFLPIMNKVSTHNQAIKRIVPDLLPIEGKKYVLGNGFIRFLTSGVLEMHTAPNEKQLNSIRKYLSGSEYPAQGLSIDLVRPGGGYKNLDLNTRDPELVIRKIQQYYQEEAASELTLAQQYRFSSRRTTLTEEQQKAAVDRAVEQFGVTEDYAKAGFILPDGRMVKIASDSPMGDGGNRYYHAEVAGKILPKMDFMKALRELLNAGWVRIIPNSGALEAFSEPTPEQYARIRGYSASEGAMKNGGVQVDLMELVEGDAFSDFVPARKLDALADTVRKFYAGESREVAPSLAREFRFASKKKGETVAMDEESPDLLNVPEEDALQWITSRIQDQMHRADIIVQTAVKEGRSVSEPQDFYMASRLSNKVIAHKMDDLSQRMVDYMYRLEKAGYSIDQVDMFRQALHAPERNELVVKDRDPKNPSGSGMREDQAEAILEALGGEKGPLRKWVDESLEFSKELLRFQYESGLLTEEEYKAKSEMFQYYAPLKGFEEENKTPLRKAFTRLGKGFGIVKKESVRIKGRQEGNLPDNVVVQSLIDYQVSLTHAEHAKVTQSFLKFHQEHPIPGVSFKLMQYTPDYNKFGEVIRLKPKEPLEENQIILKINKFDWGNTPVGLHGKEHSAEDIHGKPIVATIEDEALLKAFKSLGVERSIRALDYVNRFVRNMVTVYNPAFWMTNFPRDLGMATINIYGDDGKTAAWEVVKDVPSAIRGIWNYLEGDKTHPMARVYGEMGDRGGITGWFTIKNVKELTRELQQQMRDMRTDGDWKRLLRKMARLIYSVNQAIEMGTRLSYYKWQIDHGISKNKAAYKSANLTVDFNLKGQWGSTLNSWHLFTNANIQGIVNTMKHIGLPPFSKTGDKRSQKKIQKLVGGIFASSLLLNLAYGLFDPDDWDEINDYTKDTNLMVPIPGTHKYVSLMLPYGFNLFHALGNITADVIRGKRTLGQTAGRILERLNDTVNPWSSPTALQFVAPSASLPFIQLYENKNFFGGPIYKTQYYSNYKPNNEMYFKGVSSYSKEATQWLNDATGGDPAIKRNEKTLRPGTSGVVDVNPEIIDHLVESYLGGVGRLVEDTWITGTTALQGDVPELNHVPFLRQVMKEPTPYQAQKRVFDMLRESMRTKYGEMERKQFQDSLEYLKKEKEIAPDKYLEYRKQFENNQRKITPRGLPAMAR